MKNFALFLIRAQRLCAPVWRSLLGHAGPCCRFYPTCSEYAEQSIGRHGLISGGALAFRRILRCHPWGGWGVDPVKERA